MGGPEEPRGSLEMLDWGPAGHLDFPGSGGGTLELQAHLRLRTRRRILLACGVKQLSALCFSLTHTCLPALGAQARPLRPDQRESGGPA